MIPPPVLVTAGGLYLLHVRWVLSKRKAHKVRVARRYVLQKQKEKANRKPTKPKGMLKPMHQTPRARALLAMDEVGDTWVAKPRWVFVLHHEREDGVLVGRSYQQGYWPWELHSPWFPQP